MMNFSTWLTFFLLMTAIAYPPGPMTMFSMSSSVQNGFYRTLPAIAYALFGAKVFLWLRQRCLTHIQNKATAAILFLAGGMLACSKK